MRVRPFFWIFLATVCACILIFAATISVYKSVPMRASIDPVSAAVTVSTSVRLRLTDPEGVPINQARIISRASMLNMTMGPQQMHVQQLGQGVYLAQIRFSMPGSWQIEITIHADGFDPFQRSIEIKVV